MRLLIFFFACFLVLLGISQTVLFKSKDYINQYSKADKLFKQSENISLIKNGDELLEIKLNKEALSIFQDIIIDVEKAGDDSLAFFCHFKIGLLLHYFDSLNLAKKEYITIISLKHNSISDSFLFQPLLFIGSIYYSQNQFDSAYIFYKKAEKISEIYDNPLQEEGRLYNRLGTMYYEMGSYKQSQNYFEKAVDLLSPKDPSYNDFLTKYKSNIATSFLKLENYTVADSIFKSILSLGINVNEIKTSLGSIALLNNTPEKALAYFRSIHYNNANNIILYNKMGQTFLHLKNLDSSKKYLLKALDEHANWFTTNKNKNHGNTFQYLGDLNNIEKNYNKAIQNYHNSIQQFYPDYNEADIYKNPQTFSGVFSYINLFTTLTAKADAFEKLYKQDKKQAFLDGALNAYQSAFLLAAYVEKTYDSDEARLFLNKIKYKVHDRPIHISLQLYELTKDKLYLEEAYNFDQQNKASILSLNVQEAAIKNQTGTNIDLFEKETTIKTNITRLSLKAGQINDSSQLQKIKTDIRDYEIELGKLQNKINELPGYKAKKFAKSIPSVAQVQKLLSKKNALLSYHLSENEMVILCITSNDLSYTKQVIDSTFFNIIKSFKTSLNNYKGEEKYDGAKSSIQLYNAIVKPVLSKIQHIENLLIIPDDELNNLPFEALSDENGNFVLDKYKVQYQYSTALLRDDIKNNNNNSNKISLAMAPFASKGNDAFTKLEFTKNEIENLQGNILIDSAASKKNFLALVEKAGVLHLATHTIVNDTIPEKSLIAFYPFTDLPVAENNLYLQEIYNLKLDATKLVVLSACETGTGKLAKGEGLMSLARAFTYAGCPNILGSLWKADDKSTAWIMQRFYKYYNDDTDAATALQKAKLDYIESPEIEKRFKSPNYWAHLVLTGVPENKTNINKWIWLGLSFLLLTSIFFYFSKRKKATLLSSSID
jgi:CHAT domain-containing protein/tetratricopeptide (TPR) repeat protein